MNEPMRFQPSPDKEFRKVMDYKGEQIERSQKAKENSIHIASSGRDAVLIVTTMYSTEFEALHGEVKEEAIKSELKKWREWIYSNLYNIPF